MELTEGQKTLHDGLEAAHAKVQKLERQLREAVAQKDQAKAMADEHATELLQAAAKQQSLR